MDVADKIAALLEIMSLEEVLEQNDLTPEEAIVRLWQMGLIELPSYLDELQPGEEED